MNLHYPAIRYALAAVWPVNGLFCKVLGLVPRHEQIVASILGAERSGLFTTLIGSGEIGVAVWILSGWKYRVCAVFQMIMVLSMNLLEFFVVPELLLWGRLNIVFALVLVAIIGANAFGRPKS